MKEIAEKELRSVQTRNYPVHETTDVEAVIDKMLVEVFSMSFVSFVTACC
jgi:hypothetical protein